LVQQSVFALQRFSPILAALIDYFAISVSPRQGAAFSRQQLYDE
jgi:hypothetical protein